MFLSDKQVAARYSVVREAVWKWARTRPDFPKPVKLTRNTVAAGTPDPISTRPIIDRLFPDLAASRMGAAMISIDSGAVEWPVTTSAITAGWAATETGNVATAAAFATTDRALKPEHNLGVQARISRKALKQSGAALEDAIRRDVNGAMGVALDRAIFLGTGADGQPLGVIAGAATYGITATAINAAASWAAFRAAVVRFMTANAAGGPGAVRLMLRPEVWAGLDGALISGTAVSEWDRLVANIPAANIALTTNAVNAPAGSPAESVALLTTSAGGVSPIFVGAWGGGRPYPRPLHRRAERRPAADRAGDDRRDRRAAGAARNPDGRAVMAALLWGGASGGLELRAAEDGGARLSGRFPYFAATELGPGRRESIAGHAFRSRIDAGEEIHLLLGHDFNRPLASTRAGSLLLEDRDDALVFTATISPDVAVSTTGRDALAMIRGRLATGVSPGFIVPPGGDEVQRRGEGLLRVVRTAELHEISVVARPAYPLAQVEARSWSVPPASRPPSDRACAFLRTRRRWR